jgi:ERCC4-type nuclease
VLSNVAKVADGPVNKHICDLKLTMINAFKSIKRALLLKTRMPVPVTILVDGRESLLASELERLGATVERKQLDVADVHLVYTGVEDGLHPYIFERKTLGDLAASVADKRLPNQRLRMQSYVGGRSNQVVYIVESAVNPFTMDPQAAIGRGSVTAGAIQTILIDLQVVHGITVLVTSGCANTAEVLLRFAARMMNRSERYIAPPSNPSGDLVNPVVHTIKVKKSDAMTDSPSACAALQLSTIPGLSSAAAVAVLQHLGCSDIGALISRLAVLPSRQEAIDTLASIPTGAASGRKIGKVVATRMIALMLASKNWDS